MILFIDTNATDKMLAAVTSATDLTAISQLEQLVLGDSEPFTISFLSAASTYPAWATDATYTVSLGLGFVTAGGTELWASGTASTIVGNTRTGRLNLNTSLLQGAEFTALFYNYTSAPYGYNSRQRKRGLMNTLQIANADSTGRRETLALLPVWVCAPVLTLS